MISSTRFDLRIRTTAQHGGKAEQDSKSESAESTAGMVLVILHTLHKVLTYELDRMPLFSLP